MDDIKKENYQLTVYKLSEFQDLEELCVELVSKLVKNKRVKNNGVLKVNNKVKVLYLSFICRRMIFTRVALYSPLGIFVRKLKAALLLKMSRHLKGSTWFVYENSFGIRAILFRLSAITIWFTVLFIVRDGNDFIQQITSISVIGSSLINKILSSIIFCSFLVLWCFAFQKMHSTPLFLRAYFFRYWRPENLFFRSHGWSLGQISP